MDCLQRRCNSDNDLSRVTASGVRGVRASDLLNNVANGSGSRVVMFEIDDAGSIQKAGTGPHSSRV